MSYLPFTSSPLIALYENSGQSIGATGETLLEIDTNLYQGELLNNTFTLNSFDCFITSDIKYNSTTGYGTLLRIYLDGTRHIGEGSCQSGTVAGYSSGSGGEIIAANVSSGQEVQVKFRKGGSQTVTFDTFTRIIGVIT